MGTIDRRRSAVCRRGRCARRSRASSMPGSRTCRSSARTATPSRAGMRANEPFPDPAQLLIVPDHYVFRMLFSQGMRLEDLGVPTADGAPVETDGRTIWRLFAENYHLFRGTPTRLWLDHTLRAPVRHRRAADGQRPPTRTTTRSPTLLQTRRLSPARAVRALQHRGRSPPPKARSTISMAPDDPRQRLEGPRRHRLPARLGRRSRLRGLLPPISTGSARSPAAIPAPGPAISTRTASAAPSSRSSARPRPTTATRRPRRRTFPTRQRRRCSTASGAAPTTSASGGCSARRC